MLQSSKRWTLETIDFVSLTLMLGEEKQIIKLSDDKAF